MWRKEELNRNFGMALKSNRIAELSREAKQKKEYVKTELLQPGRQTVEVRLEELNYTLSLIKQVFKNEDDTVGELYLDCSDLTLT